ncbi:MAG: alcohol dehydrogenase catalytic domain-containing protein [Lachnospiraceae bacterium]|nr:alcohol dehydrogenase catalytic domain-containing protein [Lachnospiraceae bacterium]
MTETFQRAVITEPGKIVLEEVEKRAPGLKEVRIRVHASAVCGSDLHIYSGRHPYVKLPTTIGHELAGVVEQVGDGVEKVKVGDRVCVEPLIACGTCYYCQRGRYDYCEHLKLKYRTGSSGYGEFYYAEERWVHKLPEDVSFEEGALMEPFACAVHAVMKAKVRLGDTVCVMGDGPIALMLAQLSRAAGGTHVFVLGLSEKNLAVAEDFGCIPLRSGPDGVKEVLEQTEGRGVDVSFEAVGVPATFLQTLEVTRRGGRAVIFGIFEEELRTRALMDAMVKEIQVVGTSSYCWDFERGLELLETGRIDLKPLITHHFPLSQVKEALEIKKDRDASPLKVILHP